MRDVIHEIIAKQERENMLVQIAKEMRAKEIIAHLKAIQQKCSSCHVSNPLCLWGYVKIYYVSQGDIVTEEIEMNELQCRECGARMNIQLLPLRPLLHFVFTEQKLLPTETGDLFAVQYIFDPESDDEPQLWNE